MGFILSNSVNLHIIYRVEHITIQGTVNFSGTLTLTLRVAWYRYFVQYRKEISGFLISHICLDRSSFNDSYSAFGGYGVSLISIFLTSFVFPLSSFMLPTFVFILIA